MEALHEHQRAYSQIQTYLKGQYKQCYLQVTKYQDLCERYTDRNQNNGHYQKKINPNIKQETLAQRAGSKTGLDVKTNNNLLNNLKVENNTIKTQNFHRWRETIFKNSTEIKTTLVKSGVRYSYRAKKQRKT